ncbi:hypothetical protein K470DRAFT_46180 [Piedraia hortae CBS 480.64]|uniref:Histone-lysine N-methyltransferase, H3 lysine-4 specific n=1 Tax=Piedraia hortae CBS 480.64 TaxID=1314780 RepID=A0A6A7C0H8_9PEZI|nr:hypothetical protein K470DRAFT_46180 [Piedraia hortae CBS 480.64]
MSPPIRATGYRVHWDADDDGRKARRKDFGPETHSTAPPDPRLAIPGYISGQCRAKDRQSKAIWRPAPYRAPPYKVDQNSVGPADADQIFVTGYDPFLPEATLHRNFSSSGSIASLINQTDPDTGSFLGLASIKFRDGLRDGVEVRGADAARRAVEEFNGQRIGIHVVRVTLDRERRKFDQAVARELEKLREQRVKDEQQRAAAAVRESAPPPNAPRGPSIIRPTPRRPSVPAHGPVDGETGSDKMLRRPYIHITPRSVPPRNSTLPHLKQRLRMYSWTDIYIENTGYYIIFHDSQHGQREAERCYKNCNNAPLFEHRMQMELRNCGHSNGVRGPNLSSVAVTDQPQPVLKRKREEDEDFEVEKRERAENLDPVKAALEILYNEVRKKVIDDVKARIAIPVFDTALDPAKHAAKRRKLGLPEPQDREDKTPAWLIHKEPAVRPRNGYLQPRPLRPHDKYQRSHKLERDIAPLNVFADERRRRHARPANNRGLQYKLMQLYSDNADSDDEGRTPATRDTGQDSRPLSRASRRSTPFDADSTGTATPTAKRRKEPWADENIEDFTAEQKRVLVPLMRKEPEDLATHELEKLVSALSQRSKFAIRARDELYMRQRSKADDDLFRVKTRSASADTCAETPHEAAPAKTKATKQKKPPSRNKPEERETPKAVAKSQQSAKARSKSKSTEPESDICSKPTFDRAQRTVDDNLSLVMDLDGWWSIIKDEEDLKFFRQPLKDVEPADIRDADAWVTQHLELKNFNGVGTGPTTKCLGIPGYYVSNPSGSARTEPIKHILNEEKSKYLPHRIKVQQSREQREAQALANPSSTGPVPKSKFTKGITAATTTSRSTRANNRRMLNDMKAQNDAESVGINALSKRKKLVKFDRSAIHGWGLYAEEDISMTELIIEYVGEHVRQKVADIREIAYDKQGVGSSYLFRMRDDFIIDATKKGGIARFINHSCDPNCTAKIINVGSEPRIVIYALKDIAMGQELTYDYKFEREIGSTDRIPCLCGSANCKRYLN